MYPNCEYCLKNNYKKDDYCFAGQKFSVIKCANCGLARTWPIPVESGEVEKFYEEFDDYNLLYKNLNLRKIYCKKILKIINIYKKRGKLLDVGCNIGVMVKESMNKGYSAAGIDISNSAIEFGKKYLSLSGHLFHGILSENLFLNKKFDIITYVHVLEHITDLNAEFEKIKKILKQDGILLISAPNYNSLWRVLLRNKWYGFSPKQHIWQFSRESLEKILKKNNFSILKTHTRHSLDHEINFSPKGFIKLIILVCAFIFGYGDNLMLIAKKT